MQALSVRGVRSISVLVAFLPAVLQLCAAGRCDDLTAAGPSTAAAVNRPALDANPRPLRQQVSVEPLRAIEQRLLPPSIVPGPWSHATLPEFYWAENAELIARFNQAMRTFDQNPRSEYRALTLVSGAAGVGKTFLKNEVFKQEYPKSAVHKFDLRELYEAWADDGICSARKDLASGNIELNHLLATRDDRKPYLLDYLASKDAGFFVIDSLDEIHPDDYSSTLRQIHQFVTSTRRPFVHVVVFGRGVAFREFCKQRLNPAGKFENAALFLLHPPNLRTTGDLTVSSWNYHTWKYGLSWAPNGGTPYPMPLGAYGDWAGSGFRREGAFRLVTSKPNTSMRPDVNGTFVEWASKSRIVASTLGNLAGNSLTREIIESDVLAGSTFDERRFMSAYFDAWLVRDTESDGRPSLAKPEQLDVYLRLLQQVAARYLHDGQVDQQGFFSVRDDDTVIVTKDGQQLAFSVRNILDRSGLKFIDPRNGNSDRYRFEPIWFHRLLVEMHNEQCRKAG